MLLRMVLSTVVVFVIAFSCYGQYRMTDSQWEINQVDSVSFDSTSSQTFSHEFPQYWVSAGFTGIKHKVGLNLTASYARSNHHIISARYINTYNAQVLPIGDIYKVREFSLLYGLMADIKFVQASASTGLGWSKQQFSTDVVPSKTIQQIGMPLNARVSLNLAVVGIGIQGYAFISKDSYWGSTIFIELGKLW